MTPAERLVEVLWRIRSATSVERWDAASLEEASRAYVEIRGGQTETEARSGYYRRLALALADRDGAPADPPELPPWAYARPGPGYPRVWLPRRAISLALVAVLAVTAAAYGAQYRRFWDDHCVRDAHRVVDRLRLPVPVGDRVVLERMADGQCVGVSAASGIFLTGEVTEPDTELAHLTELIAEENDEAVRDAKARNVPHATVIVATMLSSVVAPNKRDLSAGVNELRGQYLAQQRWNHLDDGFLGLRVPVRLLFANFGGNSAYAERTAHVIRDRVRRDPTIIAVTGMGQTRAETVRAAEIIGAPDGDWPGLPIVGSTPSGNDFTGKPFFFRTAPPNRRQAEVGARFLTQRFPGRHVWILFDQNDLYSSDLAADYRRLLLAEGSSFSRVESRAYQQENTASVDVFRPIVAEVCSTTQTRQAPQPLVVYAGRANEAATLLRDLQQACPDRAVMLGGDDLSQLETEGYGDLASTDNYAGDWLYFTTFGPTADGWAKIRAARGGSTVAPPFFAEYARVQTEQRKGGGTAFRTGPNGHVMLAYDALELLLTAVERWRAENDPKRLPGREELRKGLLAQSGYPGAAGVVTYADRGGPAGADPVDKLVVIQRVVREADGPHSRYVTAEGAL